MSQAELSRPIKARQLPAEPVVIEASEAERIALAKRFALPLVKSLHAEISLEKVGKAVRAQGSFNADFVQSCAVSGEEFPATAAEDIDLRFVEELSVTAQQSEDDEIELEISSEDCDEIEYEGDYFDLGEAVAQSLGLAIDPYAEGPNAGEFRSHAGIVAEGEQEGPLADALKALKKD